MFKLHQITGRYSDSQDQYDGTWWFMKYESDCTCNFSEQCKKWGGEKGIFTGQTVFTLISTVFSAGAVILQEVPQWTWNVSVFYWSISKNDRQKYFERVKVNPKIISGKTKLHFDAYKVLYTIISEIGP